MTKKDFEAIARVIREHGIAESNPEFVSALMLVLGTSNPRFSVIEFMRACRHEK